ncbi:hypothetical protein RB195_022994 [Necator americanus]|uniref:Uncharacterized protein n=1 Tax=Necator americanus TaxID=51031 RepID=A0ABR1EI01_NECAM
MGTVSTDANLHVLLGAAERIKFRLIGVQKNKSRRSGVPSVYDGTLLICGERVRKMRKVNGFGLFIVHPSIVFRTRSYHLVWPFFVSTLCAICNINCKAPTSAAKESELDVSYEALQEVFRNRKSFGKFVIGDFCAKQGKTKEEYRIGRFGLVASK